jgi:hypothetical protein
MQSLVTAGVRHRADRMVKRSRDTPTGPVVTAPAAGTVFGAERHGRLLTCGRSLRSAMRHSPPTERPSVVRPPGRSVRRYRSVNTK